jgi:hypothetical protein
LANRLDNPAEVVKALSMARTADLLPNPWEDLKRTGPVLGPASGPDIDVAGLADRLERAAAGNGVDNEDLRRAAAILHSLAMHGRF